MPALQNSLQNLLSVAEECSQPGWDGHRAEAVSQEAYRRAYLFVGALPSDVPTPAIGADPDGHLTLEWYQNPNRTLSVSISPSGELHFSALVGQSTAYGTEFFLGDVPPSLLELIRSVYLDA
jgi:hypothetical protein